MKSRVGSHQCSRCGGLFTQKSSLLRHERRCHWNIKAPPRQKACSFCAEHKVRCDLQRPRCGRCAAKGAACEFPAAAAADTDNNSGGDAQAVAGVESENSQVMDEANEGNLHQSSVSLDGVDESSIFSRAERGSESAFGTSQGGSPSLPTWATGNGTNARFGTAEYAPNAPSQSERRRVLSRPGDVTPGIITRHTMQFIIRVLKSWPRSMAVHGTEHLPPIIHPLQLSDGVPAPLANCMTLAKMWDGHGQGSEAIVQSALLQEINRLLHEVLVILGAMLMFGFGDSSTLSRSQEAEILVSMWDVKYRLAGTGLFIEEEESHALPDWRQWAITSAKRRTILALHHLEWAWSVLYGYPRLTCYELFPLPNPAARYLWQETDEETWKRSYRKWLRQWDDGAFKMEELFYLKSGVYLSRRAELWLGETDEFGTLLMAEGMYDCICVAA